MKKIINPRPNTWAEILKRPVQRMTDIRRVVQPVLERVQSEGDKAVKDYTLQFDGVSIDELVVSAQELHEAEKLVSEDLKAAMKIAKANIEAFHKAQVQQELRVETMPGVLCSRKSVPIDKVGLYIPGGSAPLFSTVLMLAIPAQLAGCKEIVLCTPPDKAGKVHPAILYAAMLAGTTKVIKAGGAQAIAAMAYGTQSVPQVYKIFGPGNQFVTAAKQLVSLDGTAIDMPAGPSEVLVYADASAKPAFVAADLLSQAEHGPDSQVVLVSPSESILDATVQELQRQLKELPRWEITEKALQHALLIQIADKDEAMALINQYAPEHLIFATDNAAELAEQVRNAGSVFVGHYTPESAGDYASGTNHTLPTNGAALAYSGVSLDAFVKKITFQEISPAGLRALGPVVEIMAEAEQLQAHKNAVTIRLNNINRS
jgi:histidinol dehydrogenase